MRGKQPRRATPAAASPKAAGGHRGPLLLICGYLSACLASFGAIGRFVFTLTEQPIGETLAVVGLAVVSQILVGRGGQHGPRFIAPVSTAGRQPSHVSHVSSMA